MTASVLALWMSACTRPGPALPAGEGDPARGRDVFAIAGGCGCHTPEKGSIGAGGNEIETPFGTFYSTNITSDREHGIGGWTDEQIDAALRHGVLPDGTVESPVMPYYRYAGMSDRDARDLIAYLRTLPPAPTANRPADVKLPFPGLAMRGWRMLFAKSVTAPAEAPTEDLALGRYLTDHVSICGDCHTPRNRFGASDDSMYLAGMSDGPIGRVPNITPDPTTGIGDWDVSDIESLLEQGMLPNFDNVQGAMAEVVEGTAGAPGYGAARKTDRHAIAVYLKTVPPIVNRVAKRKEK